MARTKMAIDVNNKRIG